MTDDERKEIRGQRKKSAREAALEGLPRTDFSDAYLETWIVYRNAVRYIFNAWAAGARGA